MLPGKPASWLPEITLERFYPCHLTRRWASSSSAIHRPAQGPLHPLAKGFVPDPTIVFATEAAFLVIFVLITWGFGHFSSLLFVFLLDIDLLYVFKVAGHLLDTKAFAIPIALLTVGLAVLSLWIAFALLLNPVTGRRVFTLGTPVFRSAARPPVDLAARTALVAALYGAWRDAGTPLASGDLRARLAVFGEQRLDAELAYLAAKGVVENGDGKTRLSPAGIDLWEKHLAG